MTSAVNACISKQSFTEPSKESVLGLTNECPRRCKQSNTPRYAITVPTTDIFEIRENKGCSALRRQVYQRNEEYEEEADMVYESKSLNMGENPDAKDIDQNSDEQDSPV